MEETYLYRNNTIADLVMIQTQMPPDERRDLRDGLLEYHNNNNRGNVNNFNVQLTSLKPIEMKKKQVSSGHLK